MNINQKLVARIFTILVYAPPIIACVYLGGLPFMIMMLVSAFLALQEMYHMFQLRSGKWHDIFYFGYMITSILFITVYMKEMKFIWNYTLLSIVLGTVVFFICELFLKKVFWIDSPLAYLIRSIVYVGVMSLYAILLRELPQGLNYCLFLVGVVWVNDIFAYLIGKPLGKHKLSPIISPKKSIEGALGATLGAILMAISLKDLIKLDIFHAILLGLAISIFAQIGDLVESLLKRELKVKDSGNLFPGHGGILDRLDSFFLTFPVFYYFIYYFVK